MSYLNPMIASLDRFRRLPRDCFPQGHAKITPQELTVTWPVRAVYWLYLSRTLADKFSQLIDYLVESVYGAISNAPAA